MGKKVAQKHAQQPRKDPKAINRSPKVCHSSPIKKSIQTTDAIYSRQISQQALLNDSNNTPTNEAQKDLQLPSRQAISIESIEKKIEVINNFYEEIAKQDSDEMRFLMISGPPASGKTYYAKQILKNKIVQIIFINRQIKSFWHALNFIYQQISHQFGWEPSYKQQSSLTSIYSTITQKIISILGKLLLPVIVIFKNIDQLFDKTSNDYDYASQFFTIFSQKQGKIGLIGTGDNIEPLIRCKKKFNPFVQCKIESIKNIVFKPYNREDIFNIVQQRFRRYHYSDNFKVDVSDAVVELATNKFLSITNNVASIVDYVETVVWVSQANLTPPKKNQGIRLVKIEPHHLQIFKKVEFSIVSNAQRLPTFHKIALMKMSQIISKQELLYLNQERVLDQIVQLLKNSQIPKNMKSPNDLLNDIESYGLIKMQKKGTQTRVILMIGSQDIRRCISGDSEAVQLLQKINEKGQERLE